MTMMYKFPGSMKEVLEHLNQTGNAKIIAGGTDLSVQLADGAQKPDVLLDITRIEELKGIRLEEDGLTIGSATTLAELCRRNDIPLCLLKGAESIGSPQIRNLATIGGNICNASPCGDTLTPLVVLGALFILVSKEGVREISVENFFKGPKATVLGEKEMLKEIRIPSENLQGTTSFHMIGKRKGQAISQVNTAVWMHIEDEIVQEVRISLGSVAPVPVRAFSAEKVIRGNPVTEEKIEEAKRTLTDDISPISDVRASMDYRIITSEALLSDVLTEAWNARGGRR